MTNIYVLNEFIFSFSTIFLTILTFLSWLTIKIIISKNPIYSIIISILLFSCISCYLILQELNFSDISYLLVHVGAVSFLFLFIILRVYISFLFILLRVYISSLFIPNWSDIEDSLWEEVEKLIRLYGDNLVAILDELIRILGNNFTFIISLLIIYLIPLIIRMIIDLLIKLFPTVRQIIRISVCRVLYNQDKYFAVYDSNDWSCLLLLFAFYGQWHNICYRYVNVGELGIFRFALIFKDSKNIIHYNETTTTGNVVRNLVNLRYHVFGDYIYRPTPWYNYLVDGYRIHWRNLFTNPNNACFVIIPGNNYALAGFFARHHVGLAIRTIGHIDTELYYQNHMIVVADKRYLLL